MASIARPHVPEDELHAYCDGELSPGQRVEISEHLLSCLICRSQHAEVEVVRARVSRMLAIAAPRRSAVPAAANSRRTSFRRQAPRVLVAASIAAIGVGVWFSTQPANSPRGSTLASLGVSGFFRVGRSDVDAAAIRGRQLTMADRDLQLPHVHAGPTTPMFVPPVAIGRATEVDPVVASEWTLASVDDALRLADGRLPHVPDLPVKLVRIHPSPDGGRPTVLVRQQLPSGRAVWVLEGLERDIAPVDQILQASGISMSQATRTRPDYVVSGTETSITVRMVRVVGYLPVDSLNALAQKIVLR